MHERNQIEAFKGGLMALKRGLAVSGVVAATVAGWYTSDAFALGGGTVPAPPPPPVDAAPKPEGLKGIPIPTPSNASEFVANSAAAVRLGKALFWDMQLGSDGKTACATCHFQAGADSRSRNQVSPGLNRMANPTTPNPDQTFQVGGPNYQFKVDDFPFHKFSNPDDRNSTVLRTHNDVSSSQGIFNSAFRGVTPGAVADSFSLSGDPTFQVAGLQTRRVEPRNSPTVINSIFNFRNFWDGRAEYLFNGASPFGALDANARVYKKNVALLLFETLDPVQVRINNASLASLATGPGLSVFEMSAAGRTWPQVGRRLLAAKPLAQQQVSSTDSVLWANRDTVANKGLTGNYESMVKAAFQSPWWSSTKNVTINGVSYNQREANFSLYFGLAIQAYLMTQVSDDSPFDKYMAGNGSAMSPSAAAGMGIFFGKGSCANCHGGAEFTNASVRKVLAEPMSRMVMGNGGTAVYDEGFYNTAVSKTLEDIANGAINGVGRPDFADGPGPASGFRAVQATHRHRCQRERGRWRAHCGEWRLQDADDPQRGTDGALLPQWRLADPGAGGGLLQPWRQPFPEQPGRRGPGHQAPGLEPDREDPAGGLHEGHDR